MLTPEWISAIAAIISLPISIWAIISTKGNTKNIGQVAKKIDMKLEGNTLIGSGSLVQFGDKK